MTTRKTRLISAIAALSILTTDALATATVANAAQPLVQQAQAEDERGVVIVSLQRDGPAAKAGLKRGDILLEIDGKDVTTARDVRDATSGKKAGEAVELTYLNNGQEETATVTLGDTNGRAVLGITTQGGPTGSAVERMPIPNVDPSQMPEFETRVIEVTADSPAAKAGLQKDDVILAINGTDVKPADPLGDLIGKFKPNDEITLKIKRADKEQEIKVTLGENPDKQGTAFLGIRYAPSFGIVQGMPGMPGMPGRGDRLPFPAQSGAVVVGEVAKDSPAEKAGLKAGDVISTANGSAIKTPTDLVNLVSKSKVGDKLTLSVKRDGSDATTTIDVTLGENPDKKEAAWLGVSLGGRWQIERQSGPQGLLPFPMPFNFDFGNFEFSVPQPQLPGANDGSL